MSNFVHMDLHYRLEALRNWTWRLAHRDHVTGHVASAHVPLHPFLCPPTPPPTPPARNYFSAHCTALGELDSLADLQKQFLLACCTHLQGCDFHRKNVHFAGVLLDRWNWCAFPELTLAGMESKQDSVAFPAGTADQQPGVKLLMDVNLLRVVNHFALRDAVQHNITLW